MRGNSEINLEGEVDGSKFKYTIPDTAHAGWEMKGRHRVRATPIGETHYAVLNDFDLATIMGSGQLPPSKNGSERTGTKPLMAVELLSGMRGSVLRTGYHDLESIVWCLVWYCKEVEDWKYSDSAAVANSKISWAHNYGHIPPKDAREDVADLWAPTWSIVRYATFMISNTLSPPTYRALLDLIDAHISYRSMRPEKKEWDSKSK
jgi:hypothetical protein